MSEGRDWPGAKWWKFDFHSHTPASKDYGKGLQQAMYRQISPQDWLLNYMRAGIDCVAVTDHNTGEWFDRLTESLHLLSQSGVAEYRPLYLFPGVELSVHGGLHILAILPEGKTSSDISHLLGAVGFTGEKGETSECTHDSASAVIENIAKLGGLAIPAHVDQSCGLFVEVKGISLQQVIDNPEIIAISLRDKNFQKPVLYEDSKKKWSEVVGSDAHHPDSNGGANFPGSHYTWVKMSNPSLEGLRLALLDMGYKQLARFNENLAVFGWNRA